MTTEAERCETCRFFRQALFATGPCLRHAPTRDPNAKPYAEQSGGTTAIAPWVRVDHWCGDWEPNR